MRLPVDEVIPDVLTALERSGRAVLQAPPGAGKTTRVPPALLHAGWREDGRILLLEPRRLAARAAARRISELVGDDLGGTVGLVTRDERRVSGRTRIEVVTEGVLVRRLQRDPGLEGIAAVVFDEFHERSLPADLGLALTLDARRGLREDLRVVVMSATLDGARVARLLGDAPVITSEGRRYPVETHHRPRPLDQRVEEAVVAAVPEALDRGDGDVLVFLPGAGEIRRAARALRARLAPGVVVTPLYGALPPEEQDRAIAPPPPGTRKVVLATDIAETSVTIEGVRAVVDGGLTREPRFDPRTGMSRLVTVRVSRSSADQRRGRAGRTAPGICVRLWSEREDAGLEPHRTAEVLQADLAGFALELAAWGAAPDRLPFLDQPPAAAYRQAVELLERLDAVDGDGRITSHGRELVDLPVHPRLGHMLLRSRDAGLGSLACEAAALLADRDVLSTGRTSSSDLAARIRVLRGGPPPRGAGIRRGALGRAREEVRRLARALDLPAGGTDDPDRVGEVLLLAYPDRLARRRGGRGRFVLANGRGATLPEGDVLAGEELLVVADVDLGAGESRIFLAAPLDEAGLERAAGGRIEHVEVVAWDEQRGDVVAERQRRVGAVVLDRAPLAGRAPADATEALLEGIRRRGLELLPWDRDVRDLRLRAGFLHRTLGAPWPDMSEDALLAELETWLAPFLTGRRRVADLSGVPLQDALWQRIGWERRAELATLAPTHLQVPSGARVRLDYGDGGIPVLPVRVQQAFGWTTTPTVAGGRVPVIVHLLSPAQRPVQVTQDLAGFWERTYPEVRAELRGRYPKHAWPEDPTSAVPTDRAKRRR